MQRPEKSLDFIVNPKRCTFYILQAQSLQFLQYVSYKNISIILSHLFRKIEAAGREHMQEQENREYIKPEIFTPDTPDNISCNEATGLIESAHIRKLLEKLCDYTYQGFFFNNLSPTLNFESFRNGLPNYILSHVQRIYQCG